MKFKYIAKEQKGKTITAIIEADTMVEARKKLADQGYSIVSLKPYSKKKSFSTGQDLNIGWVKSMDVALFVKNLSIMIKAGLTLLEALEISSDQATGKLKIILKKVSSLVQEGKTLAQSLATYPKYFKQFYIDVIKVGETSGSLEENLRHLSVQIEKDVVLRRKIKAALIYPIFVLGSTLTLGIILATFVLPRLSKLINSLNMELPWTTKVILWISEIFSTYGWWVMVGIGALIMAISFISKLKIIKPFTHYILVKLPPAGRVVRSYNIARITRSLGVLLHSGLTINESLQTLENIMDNIIYKKAIKIVLEDVEKGKSVANSLSKHKNIFPPMVIKMVNVGERSGQLEDIMMYLANFYEDEVDAATKNLSAIVEPVLLIVIGIIVGFVGLSIITPIYKITGSISPSR